MLYLSGEAEAHLGFIIYPVLFCNHLPLSLWRGGWGVRLLSIVYPMIFSFNNSLITLSTSASLPVSVLLSLA